MLIRQMLDAHEGARAVMAGVFAHSSRTVKPVEAIGGRA